MVGFVGGVGSGKSAVARGLATHWKTAHFDADRAGHELLRDPEIIQQLKHVYGEAIFDPDGSVNRSRLGGLVFGNEPEQVAGRTRLEQTLHPAIRTRFESFIETARKNRDVDLIVVDAALLFEAAWGDLCDVVVFVATKFDVRLERVRQHRGWSREELIRREASQWSLDRKRSQSDITVENSGPLEQTVADLTHQLRILCPQLRPPRNM